MLSGNCLQCCLLPVFENSFSTELTYTKYKQNHCFEKNQPAKLLRNPFNVTRPLQKWKELPWSFVQQREPIRIRQQNRRTAIDKRSPHTTLDRVLQGVHSLRTLAQPISEAKVRSGWKTVSALMWISVFSLNRLSTVGYTFTKGFE